MRLDIVNICSLLSWVPALAKAMTETINEKVSVLLLYSRERHLTMPCKLRWQGRDYVITKLGYHHSVREGRKLLHKFAVSTGALDFRLSFDTETLEWVLEEVSDGLAA